MFKIEKTITIDAPVEAVFLYAADPHFAPEYYTDVNEVQNLRRLPNGGYAYRFMPLDLTVESSELVPNERIVARGTACGPLDEITLTTTFESIEGGKTRVTSHEEHRFKGGVFARLGEKGAVKYFDRAAEMTLAALKARIESGVVAAQEQSPVPVPVPAPAATRQ